MVTKIAALVGVGLALVGVGMARRGAAQSAATQADLRKPFIGTWRLVSVTGGDQEAQRIRGVKPTGLIIYDAYGTVAAQIQPDRPRPTYSGAPTPEQARERILGYTAYFGDYTVDERTHRVTHHRQAMLAPGPVDFVRTYEFSADGNRLTLTPVDTTGPAGPPRHLLWERVR